MKHKRQELQDSPVVLYLRTQKLSDFMLLYVSLIGLSSLGAVAKIRAPSKRCFNIKIFNDTKRRAVSLRRRQLTAELLVPLTAFNTKCDERLINLFPHCFSRLTRNIDVAILILSIRLSVRDVPVLDENGLTYCHSFFTVR